MSNPWPETPLKEVLFPVSRAVQIDPTTTYRLLGARWYAKGLYIKAKAAGSEIGAKTLYLVNEGDFVYNRLFAWKGSFALASKDTEGCFVSNEFPCFQINEEKAIPSFIGWYFRQSSVWQEALDLSAGVTGLSRNRLKEDRLLAMRIALPSLPEQRRIAQRMDAIGSRVSEIERLREISDNESHALLAATLHKIIAKAPKAPMRLAAPIVRRPVDIEPAADYPELGIRSFGKGTFQKPSLKGIAVGNKRLFRIEPGDLIFSNVFAWEGAVAVAKPEDNGRFGSHRFITCVPKKDFAKAEFLKAYFQTREGLEIIGAASPGGAGRNRTLGIEALQNILVPIPHIDLQEWFVLLQAKVEEMLNKKMKSEDELDGLVASALNKAFDRNH